MGNKIPDFSSFDELDESELLFDELQEVEKRNSTYQFPTVTIFKRQIYFSKKAAPFLPEYIKWRINDEWCVFIPSFKGEKNAYSLRRIGAGVAGRFPAELESSYPLMKGTHKLYKSGKNFCFKRYEIL